MTEQLHEEWYRYPEYAPALDLALNYAAGGLEILDSLYHEENDSWYVEVQEGDYYDMGFRIDGSFVRKCFKVTQKGVKSWIKTKKES
jgi:hypothetical protein